MKYLLLALISLALVVQTGCHQKEEVPSTVFEGQLNITAASAANFGPLINDIKTKETINGDVYIKTYGNNFLSFLKNIKTINGNLEISETAITDFDFLSSLETVNGIIKISGNNNLQSTKGLENLKNAKGLWLYGISKSAVPIDLTAIQNIKVTDALNFQYLTNDSFPFFKNITSLNDFLSIGNCNIKDLKSLANLTSIGKDISLVENNNISNLEGLNQLSTVGWFNILYNRQLETLKGLDNLKTVTNTLSISSMNLKSISNLNNLNSVGSFIMRGTQCKSLKGLENLSKCEKFLIYSNPTLEDFCALKPILNGNFISQWVISDNLKNPSITEIKEKCQ